jgi:uncharacterized protein YdeI (YjbR/CyaY-like superfamily)
MQPGIDRPPTNRSGDAPQVPAKLPRYIESALRKHAVAWKFWQSLAPSHRRNYLAWIDSAKKQETKLKRLDETVAKLAAGHKPGLK